MDSRWKDFLKAYCPLFAHRAQTATWESVSEASADEDDYEEEDYQGGPDEEEEEQADDETN